MKRLLLLLAVAFILSCSDTKKQDDQLTYMADDIIVSHNREARLTTFVTREGEAISGTVVKKFDNGNINKWEVEKGLATRQIRYYPDGQVERILEMKRGTVHGSFLMFYPDGSKYVEQHFENGEPVGTWYRWNREGEITETIRH